MAAIIFFAATARCAPRRFASSAVAAASSGAAAHQGQLGVIVVTVLTTTITTSCNVKRLLQQLLLSFPAVKLHHSPRGMHLCPARFAFFASVFSCVSFGEKESPQFVVIIQIQHYQQKGLVSSNFKEITIWAYILIDNSIYLVTISISTIQLLVPYKLFVLLLFHIYNFC